MKRDAKKPIITSSTPSSTLTPKSSITMELTKESSSSYFPGCRKDANCACQICLDSINATLDLMTLTNHKKTNNLNRLRPSPIPFGSPSSPISTPKVGVRRTPSPCWKSTARVRPSAVVVSEEDGVGKRNRRRFGGLVLVFVVLILGMELGFHLMVSRALRTELSAAIVRDLGERAFDFNGSLNRKLQNLKSELELYVNSAQISNCTHNPRVWEVHQDGLLLRSRCVLYRSLTEEVSIWGWPLQTAGLLVSRFSSRSFTVLSGRATQWPEGNAGYLVVKARGSWVQDRYKVSAVQLDGQTWVIEYSRSMLLEHKGLCSAVWKFIKCSLWKDYFRKMSLPLGWVAETFRGYSAEDGVNVHPT